MVQQLDLEDHLRGTDPSQPKQARYEARLRARGLVAVKVWVPERWRKPLLSMAEELREHPDRELRIVQADTPPGKENPASACS